MEIFNGWFTKKSVVFGTGCVDDSIQDDASGLDAFLPNDYKFSVFFFKVMKHEINLDTLSPIVAFMIQHYGKYDAFLKL